MPRRRMEWERESREGKWRGSGSGREGDRDKDTGRGMDSERERGKDLGLIKQILRSSFLARPRHPALLFHYVFDEQQTLSCSVARHIMSSRPLCTLSLFLSFFIISPPSYASRLLTESSRHCHMHPANAPF